MSDKNTQLQQVDLNQIQQIGEFGIAELMALKESIAKKLSIPQFNLFMYQMNRMGLDPSLGHGVPIIYGSDVNIRIEYEGLKSLAQKSDGYKGIYAQAIHEEDDFSAETDDDGVISKIQFKMGKPPRGKVVGAYAVAKREGYKDFIVICEVADFEKYVKKNASFWKLDNGNIDPDMAKKFAATRAVKGQFNIAVVVEENMMALNGEGFPAPPQPERRDVTAEAEQSRAQQQQAALTDKSAQPSAGEVDQAAKITVEIKKKFKELGIRTAEAIAEFCDTNGVTFKDSENKTVAELTTLNKMLSMAIAEKAAADDEPL